MSHCTPETHNWRYDSGRTFTTEISTGNMRAPHAGPFRVCDGCLACHQLADIPARHPESMTTELGDDVEEQLAELDAELFPKEAAR